MLARRVVVCLDVDAGRVVKGVQFRELRDVGDPAELAAHVLKALQERNDLDPAVEGNGLTQAQRDFFGAHTYERVDKSGVYHTDWGGDGSTEQMD